MRYQSFVTTKGISFAKASAVEIGGFERRQLVVSGSKKTVELKPLEQFTKDGTVTQRYDRQDRDWNWVTKKELSTPFDRYDGMMRSFADMVRGEKVNPYTPDYELGLYKLIMKACGKKEIN